MPIMARPGKATSPGWRRSENSQATSWQTACRRIAIRPWSPSVASKVSTAPRGGSAQRAATSWRGGRPLRLERQKIVAAAPQDDLGDRALRADGVDRHQGAFEGEA